METDKNGHGRESTIGYLHIHTILSDCALSAELREIARNMDDRGEQIISDIVKSNGIRNYMTVQYHVVRKSSKYATVACDSPCVHDDCRER